MGGMILAPRIETSLNRDDLTHFYRGYGKATPGLWAETRKLLNEQLSNQIDIQVAIKSAIEAFEIMEEMLKLSSQTTYPLKMVI